MTFDQRESKHICIAALEDNIRTEIGTFSLRQIETFTVEMEVPR